MGVSLLLPAGSLGAHCLRANPGRGSNGLLQVSPSPTKPKPPHQRAAAPIPLARCVEPLTAAVSPVSLTLCPPSCIGERSTSLVVAAAETILKQQIAGITRRPKEASDRARNIDMAVRTGVRVLSINNNVASGSTITLVSVPIFLWRIRNK